MAVGLNHVFTVLHWHSHEDILPALVVQKGNKERWTPSLLKVLTVESEIEMHAFNATCLKMSLMG